jgi:hypothetical protein
MKHALHYLIRAMMIAALAVALGAVISTARADGKILTDGIDPTLQTSNCTVPATREDGSPLLLSEIAYLDFYLTQDLSAPDGEPVVSDFAVSCTATFDLSTLAYGQWYLYWKTVDTGMQVSQRSTTVPFVWKVKDAPPSAPGNVTLQ